MNKSDRSYMLLFLAPTIFVLILLLAYPMFYVWRVSLDDFELTAPDERHFVALSNFTNLVKDDRFTAGLSRSLQFTVLSTTITFILGFAISLLLNTRFTRGKSLFQTVYIIPMVLTPYVIGQTWRFLVDFGYGPVQYFLTSLGFPRVNFLGEPRLAFGTAILVDAWQWTPFVILILSAGLEGLKSELLEAARVDGASWWQEFRLVKVPLLRSSISAVLLIRLMDTFREFDKIFALTAGGPGTATEVLSLYIYRTGFQYFKMGHAAAMSLVMLFIIIFVSSTFVQRTGVIKLD